jgi:hypothetical protein
MNVPNFSLAKMSIALLFFLNPATSRAQPFSQQKVLLDSTGADIQSDLIDVEDIVYLSHPSDSQTYLFQFVNDNRSIYELTEFGSMYHGLTPNLGALLIGFYDFNQDGILDLLGSREISFGTGNHVYQTPVSAISGNFLGLIRRAGDFDLNGTMDVVSLEEKFQGGDFVYILHVYLLSENRSILDESIFEETDEILVSQIMDFNNDGFFDVLYLLNVFGSNKIVLHLNNQDNTFTRQQLNFQGTRNFLEPGDFDNDQDTDFIITGTNGRDLHLIKNDSGSLGSILKIVDTDRLFGLEIGDINLDGNIDIIYLENESFDTFHIRFLAGLDSLLFGVPELVGSIVGSGINVSTFGHAYESWLSLKDYDHDGDLDIFANEIREQRFIVFDNLFLFTQTESVRENIDLQLFPNPVNETVFLKSDHLIKSLDIYNSLGQLVYQEPQHPSSEFYINLRQLQQGHYFVHITTDQAIRIVKPIFKL